MCGLRDKSTTEAPRDEDNRLRLLEEVHEYVEKKKHERGERSEEPPNVQAKNAEELIAGIRIFPRRSRDPIKSELASFETQFRKDTATGRGLREDKISALNMAQIDKRIQVHRAQKCITRNELNNA